MLIVQITNLRNLPSIFALACTALVAAGNASADSIPYPTLGVENPETYTFTATSSSDIVAYYLGKGSALSTATLGMLVNGVSTGITGLNTGSAAIGASVDLGSVHAGDTVTFMFNVLTPFVQTWSSNVALNSDGANHLYATTYSSIGSIPAGTYLGFEDLPGIPTNYVNSATDYNYQDGQYVVSGVAMAVSSVPLPATVWLMLSSLGGLATFARKRC